SNQSAITRPIPINAFEILPETIKPRTRPQQIADFSLIAKIHADCVTISNQLVETWQVHFVSRRRILQRPAIRIEYLRRFSGWLDNFANRSISRNFKSRRFPFASLQDDLRKNLNYETDQNHSHH